MGVLNHAARRGDWGLGIPLADNLPTERPHQRLREARLSAKRG